MKKRAIDFYIKYKLEFTIAIAIGTFFNTLLITFGIWNGINQRTKVMNAQAEMQYNDSIRGVKLDSTNDALKAVYSLEETLNKIK